MDWKVADAKNKLSEVITLALDEGPQRICRRGKAVVVISEEEYESLKGKKPSFIEFLMSGPDFEGIDLERNRSTSKDYKW